MNSSEQTKTKKVLVIDDDYSLLKLVQILLKKAGYSVTALLSCIEARKQLASSHDFDLIVLDLMMPIENGFDFLNWKDEQEELIKSIPVIVVTAKNLSEDETTFLMQKVKKIVLKGLNYSEKIVAETKSILG